VDRIDIWGGVDRRDIKKHLAIKAQVLAEK